VVSISEGLTLAAPNAGHTGELGFTPDITLDAGWQQIWKIDGSFHKVPFSVASDLDGPAWCENGSLSVGFGVVGQHCWGPTPGVPYDLGTLTAFRPGSHSAYVGVSTGAAASVGIVVSYSMLIDCGTWFRVENTVCPPVNTSPPTITGSAVVGQTLSANSGSWTLMQNSANQYTYQWQRCPTVDTRTPISGATGTTYTVTASTDPASTDVGKFITVAVTATNSGGAATMTATPVGQVPPP
jgi:hypothetical protein